MKAQDFLEKIKESEIQASDVLKALFTHKRFEDEENRKNYPDAFDSKGKTTLTFDPNQKLYHTYCPYHTNQKNGDSFAVYNKDQSFYCYSGCTPQPLNLVDLTKSILFDLPPEEATNSDLSGDKFWPAARFLVEKFGKELGIELKDMKSEGGFKRDITQEILQATVEYYHFLGKKPYAKKLDDYYLNTRAFKFAEVPFQEIKEKDMIGITPRSDEGNKLFMYLLKKNFTEEQILESRVCYLKDNGTIIDSFRNHAIVPYFYKKKVFGFYGKNLDPNATIPHKRLAGIYDTPSGIDDISKYEVFFLCEGENTKEAIKAMGFPNVMEMRGAKNFKQVHAEVIGKHRKTNPKKMKKCYIVSEGDPAGLEHIQKTGKDLMEFAGVEVLIIRLPVSTKENGDPWYLDANDLFKVYQTEAKKVFLEAKENAISLDAFLLIFSLEKEVITTLSEARMALKRHSKYVETVSQMERIFILEEVINLLYQAFESVGLSKTELRNYLKEVWLRQPVKEPVEGIDEAKNSRHPYFILTQDESKYQTFKERAPQLLYVRDITRLEEYKYIIGRNILFDSSFEQEQMLSFKKITNVFSGELLDENGKVVLDNFKRL